MTAGRTGAAILVADIVGYSRLAGADEERTLARLRALRSDLIDPATAVHNGRLVKRTGSRPRLKDDGSFMDALPPSPDPSDVNHLRAIGDKSFRPSHILYYLCSRWTSRPQGTGEATWTRGGDAIRPRGQPTAMRDSRAREFFSFTRPATH